MRRIYRSLCLLALLPTPAFAAAPMPEPIHGLWMNPHNSVVVRAGPCADKLCGWIVWANAEARSDAKDSGIAQLIGVELLADYRRDGTSSWAGQVFVPDMGKRFSSQIDELSPNQLKIKGCILGGLICKSQIWNRIEQLPK